MTYSLCLYLQEGSVFLSDTRTRVGMDSLFTCHKIHHFHENPVLLIALLSQGTKRVADIYSQNESQDLQKEKKVKNTFQSLLKVNDLYQAT